MSLISPDVIAELNGLSIGAGGFLVLIGFLLWGFGWRWHRFWVVFGFTATAGIMGMASGQAAGGHILVMGLLLAFAGGILAIELAKIFAFLVGGIVFWFSVQTIFPQGQELWAVFLSGGLFGVLLYRLWTMILFSLLGIVISWHAAFALAMSTGTYDSVKWVSDNTIAVNGAVILTSVLGVLMQVVTSEKPKQEAKPTSDEGGIELLDESESGWWKKMSIKAA